MEWIGGIIDWFREAENRAAVEAITATLVVLVAWTTGLFGWIARQVRGGPPQPSSTPTVRQQAESGGVNVAGNARDISSGVSRPDDPS
jgi:hypothetical protein